MAACAWAATHAKDALESDAVEQSSGSTVKTVPLYRFLGPRYWGTWLGVAFLRAIALLPFAVQMWLGRRAGGISWRLAGKRRKVAARNLEVCFPELDGAERERLLRAHFESVGIGLVEVAMGFWTPREKMRRRSTVHGLHHLQDALATGAGVILLAGHFTTIEIGGTILTLHQPFHAMYRRFENPLFEEIMRRRRLSRVSTIIRRGDFREMLRSLKRNNAVLYMPDQAYVRHNSVRVPFFDTPAPTSTGTSRIAARAGALVVPFLPMRRADHSGYELHLFPPLQDFPSGDDEKDAARINQVFEEHVRMAPDQYLWIHRRFKNVEGIY